MSPQNHKVFVTFRLPDHVLDPLRDDCDVAVYEGPGRVPAEELAQQLTEVEGLLGFARLDAAALQAAPRLLVVSNIAVGFDNVDLEAASARGVVVTNTPGVLTDAVADLTLGLVVQLARGLERAFSYVRDGHWVKPGDALPLGLDLKEKTLSIVGMGRIGVAVAQRAEAFGMRVMYYDVRPEVESAFGTRSPTLQEALVAADFLSIHTNLTPETHHLIGRDELALMKPTAFVINTSRGPVIEQDALTEALQDGSLAGAALDVLEREPPGADEALIKLPNVFATPHMGSATRETRAAMADLAVQNLLACLRGETCENIVNPEALQKRVPRSS